MKIKTDNWHLRTKRIGMKSSSVQNGDSVAVHTINHWYTTIVGQRRSDRGWQFKKFKTASLLPLPVPAQNVTRASVKWLPAVTIGRHTKHRCSARVVCWFAADELLSAMFSVFQCAFHCVCKTKPNWIRTATGVRTTAVNRHSNPSTADLEGNAQHAHSNHLSSRFSHYVKFIMIQSSASLISNDVNTAMNSRLTSFPLLESRNSIHPLR